ncbi:MAG: DUF4167 domain-containing protein [Sphingomonadales bacterium]|nr:DUF4167 domain-containing protein [Sphingomonadales bacterium]
MSTFDRRPRHRNNNGFRRRRHSGFSSNSSGISQNHSSNLSSNHSGYRGNGRFVHNAGRLVEKYNTLAREALAQGDRIAAENYFQHADHFTRLTPTHDDLNTANSNDEQSGIINKIPGIHLDDNGEHAAKNTSEDRTNHSKEDELNK